MRRVFYLNQRLFAELYAKIGVLTVEKDFWSKVLDRSMQDGRASSEPKHQRVNLKTYSTKRDAT